MYMYNNNIICVYPSNKQEDIYKLTSPKRKKNKKKKKKFLMKAKKKKKNSTYSHVIQLCLTHKYWLYLHY